MWRAAHDLSSILLSIQIPQLLSSVQEGVLAHQTPPSLLRMAPLGWRRVELWLLGGPWKQTEPQLTLGRGRPSHLSLKKKSPHLLSLVSLSRLRPLCENGPPQVNTIPALWSHSEQSLFGAPCTIMRRSSNDGGPEANLRN